MPAPPPAMRFVAADGLDLPLLDAIVLFPLIHSTFVSKSKTAQFIKDMNSLPIIGIWYKRINKCAGGRREQNMYATEEENSQERGQVNKGKQPIRFKL
jgi:hypothetical protein